MKFFWQRSSKDKVKELPPEYPTNLSKMLDIVKEYINEVVAEGAHIVAAKTTLRHFYQMKRHFDGNAFTYHYTVDDGHRLYEDYVVLDIIIDDTLADSIVEVVSSDQRRTTIEFRDEPPPPNTNPGYMTFWK